jgi:L-lysine 2,3-aminomutase
MSNEQIEEILREFRKARNLQIFRICTGTLFLGLPFRFDDGLLRILAGFSESTGVRVTIQAHLGSYEMISPEALIAIEKIKRAGISVYSQIPIKNGINFFLNDPDKTLSCLVELGRRQAIAGVEPYMFIADMHPSTNAFYVPLEALMQMWAKLVESHDYPGLERPRTLSVLCGQGNIILSGHALFSSTKQVDIKNDRVIYKIPCISTTDKWIANICDVFRYEEPLIPGINDNPNSLETVKANWAKASA